MKNSLRKICRAKFSNNSNKDILVRLNNDLTYLTSSWPTKRSSDIHERKSHSEEDEEDEFISNCDLEALCSNQSLTKRKKA